MRDDWVVVFDSDDFKPCKDRALVLHSLDIPYEVLRDDRRASLAVPQAFEQRAKFELWQYDQENRRARPPPAPAVHTDQNGVPGAAVYVVLICLAAWLAGNSAFNFDWFAAGQVDGALVRQGEWWRLFTALTLHSGLRHLLGNVGFGVLFGVLAGRLVGSGVAWLAIVIASGAANGMNTLLLDPVHRSVGASTAVFAALGLVSGFVWRGRLMVQDRWPYRVAPIVGGIALLAFTGTGDEHTDVGAHLAGFAAGFAAGVWLTRFSDFVLRRSVQWTSGLAALAVMVIAWLAAFAACRPG